MKIKRNSIELISESDGTSAFPPLELVSVPESEMESVFPSFGIGRRAQSVPTLQYPVNRLNLYEELFYSVDLRDSIYKDNTIFTAYNMTSRTHSSLSSNLFDIALGRDNYGLNSETIANIMMPRSNSDVDEFAHEFQTSEASLMSRGNQSVANAIGSGLSTMVAGVFDNITKGFFADHGESIGTPTRSVYKGAEHRTKTYSWRLTPRNDNDLIALLQIMRTFAVLSYGIGHSSNQINNYVDMAIGAIRDHWGLDRGGVRDDTTLTSEAILNTFKYVKVMSNPTLWYIRNYNHQSVGMPDYSMFGPANITNIKIDKAPDGHFQGLAKYPNISATYDIEITFREALSHTRETIGGVV